MRCNITGCTLTAVKDMKCRTHYIEDAFNRYLDNRNLRDPHRGFFAFCKDMFPHWVTSKIANHHYAMVQGILELYNPIYSNYLNRQLMELIFREGAKSTLNKLTLAYIIAMNGKKSRIMVDGEEIEILIEEKFIAFVSETEDVAVEFIDAVREEYMNNQMLNWCFPFPLESVTEEGTKQWSKKAYKINGLYVLARGWQQQFRGRLKGSSRITFLFADDVYSETNINTPEGRMKIRKKWSNGIKNSMDTLKGKIMWSATIIHEDTVTVDNIENPLWRKIILPIMPVEKFYQFQKLHMDNKNGRYTMKFGEIKDFNERMKQQKFYYGQVQQQMDWELAWPERRDLYFVAMKFQEASAEGNISGFFQEFFHELIPESDRRFKEVYFQKLGNWEIIEINNQKHLKADAFDRPQPCKLIIGIDKSGDGQVGVTDNTVLTLIAVLKGKRVVLYQIAGKFHARDYIQGDMTARYKVIQDTSMVTVRGWMDEAIRLALRHDADEMRLGVAGQENADFTELNKICIEMKVRTRLNLRQQTTNKIERIFRTLLPLYESYSVWHADGLDMLEHELKVLGKGSKDDRPDSLEVACYGVNEPDAAPEEVSEELNYYAFVDQSKLSKFMGAIADWRTMN